MNKIVDIEDYRISKIKEQMFKEYSKYPIVGEYDIDPEILDDELIELINMNLDREDNYE